MLVCMPFEEDYPKIFRVVSKEYFSDISVIEIGYNRVPPDFSQVMRRNVYILHYVVNGGGVFCSRRFDAGDGYLVVPEELEQIRSDKNEPYESYWIMFHGTMAYEVLKNAGFSLENGVFAFDGALECSKILKNALYREASTFFEEALVMQGALFDILDIHLKKKRDDCVSTEDLGEKIKRYIDIHFAEKIRISSLSYMFGYTRNYIYTVFRQKYGVSPQKYLLELKMERAKFLIKEGKLTVEQTALAVGFDDPLYFSRIFKKKNGCSPTIFKNKK